MVKKVNKKQLEQSILKLNSTELNQLINAYNKKHSTNIKNNKSVINEAESLFSKEELSCPYCKTKKIKKNGFIKESGLQRYRCNSCGKTFNILSNTFIDKSPVSFNIWVLVLQYMFAYMSIKDIHNKLVNDNHVKGISESTVSIMTKKLRHMFTYFPIPKLSGVIQVDEKFFRESQKGFENPFDVFNPNQRRKGRERSEPSKYGTLGPEFATICIAIDNKGYSYAKVVCMGHMKLESFEDKIASYFDNITFLCSDMNPIYGQWCALNNINQYCINSDYYKNKKKCNTQAKINAAYTQDKLDYIVGMGQLSYKELQKIKREKGLNINRVNAYCNELEFLINRVAHGVSTKHLQSWVSFYNYINNFNALHHRHPLSYKDAENTLIEMIKLRKDINIVEILFFLYYQHQIPPVELISVLFVNYSNL